MSKKIKKLIIFYFLIISTAFSKSENEFKKWELKYNYTTLEDMSITEEIPYMSLYYIKEKKYTLIYNREQVYRDVEFFRNGEYVELYKGNFYYIVGHHDFLNLKLGVDYTYKLATFGVLVNKYDELDVYYYKIQLDHYFKNQAIGSFKTTFVDSNSFEVDYMARVTYKIWKYSHYFDFEKLNKGIVEFRINPRDSIWDVEAGYGYDFYYNASGIKFGVGIKF